MQGRVLQHEKNAAPDAVMVCRMNFNQAEEEYIDGEDTIGLGTLGKEGSGR